MGNPGEAPLDSAATVIGPPLELEPPPAREFWILPIPPRARWNPKNPHQFGFGLRVVFMLTAVLCTFQSSTPKTSSNVKVLSNSKRQPKLLLLNPNLPFRLFPHHQRRSHQLRDVWTGWVRSWICSDRATGRSSSEATIHPSSGPLSCPFLHVRRLRKFNTLPNSINIF